MKTADTRAVDEFIARQRHERAAVGLPPAIDDLETLHLLAAVCASRYTPTEANHAT